MNAKKFLIAMAKKDEVLEHLIMKIVLAINPTAELCEYQQTTVVAILSTARKNGNGKCKFTYIGQKYYQFVMEVATYINSCR